MVPQVSRGSESELDEEIDLAAASDTDVGDCGLEERETSTDMAGILLVGVRMVSVATVAEEETRKTERKYVTKPPKNSDQKLVTKYPPKT